MCEKFQSNFRQIGSTAKKPPLFFTFGPILLKIKLDLPNINMKTKFEFG